MLNLIKVCIQYADKKLYTVRVFFDRKLLVILGFFSLNIFFVLKQKTKQKNRLKTEHQIFQNDRFIIF